MKRLGTLSLLMLLTLTVEAQQMSYNFYEDNPPDRQFADPMSDTILFYRPAVDATGSFDELSRYGFGFIDYSGRGLPDNFTRYSLGDLALSNPFDRYPDYNVLSALGSSRAVHAFDGYDRVTRGGVGDGYAIERYDLSVTSRQNINSVKLTYSDARYRAGVNLLGSGVLPHDWHYLFSASGKIGRDAFVEGVFTESATASIALAKHFANGNDLTLAAFVSPTVKSTKGWSTAQAYDLTDNHQYNPLWGWYGDKQRSSRVRRDFTPMFVSEYRFVTAHTDFTTSLSVRAGERSVSGITWFDALSPVPDYYNKLPDWFADEDVADAVRENWIEDDQRYTQIDWREMIYANTHSDGQTAYLIDRRVEQTGELQTTLSARSRLDSRLSLEYGIGIRVNDSRFFKRADDLLGGEWFYDYDQYLIDDAMYGDSYRNDSHNPDRKVSRGQRFGYDYSLLRREADAYLTLRYAVERLQIDAGGEIRSVDIVRDGHYHKETFPERDSYGKSKTIHMMPYTFKLAVSYGFTPYLSARGSLTAAEHETVYDDVFLQPQYSNNVVSDISTVGSFNAGLGVRYAKNAVKANINGYWNRIYRPTSVKRYYDDIYSLYCDMLLKDVRTEHVGLEAGLEIAITPRLNLSLGGAVNSYKYVSNPYVDIFADVDGRELLREGVCYLNGYVSSSSPQQTFLAEVAYRLPFSWWINIGWQWAGDRHVQLAPIRRTKRIMALADSPESLSRMIEQERLPSASDLRLFIYRRFYFGQGSCVVSLDVRNLLNRTDLLYGGYEPMRILRSGNTYRPIANRYSYAYPRNVKISVAYEF